MNFTSTRPSSKGRKDDSESEDDEPIAQPARKKTKAKIRFYQQ